MVAQGLAKSDESVFVDGTEVIQSGKCVLAWNRIQ
jgi:hypothetical protein